MAKRFEEVFIDRSVLDRALVLRILDAIPRERVRIVSSREEIGSEAGDTAAGRAGFKHRLFVTREQGRFLKGCPGTPGALCCNLFVLNPIVGCPYDCTYCFLQAYQNEPFITLYANIEDLEGEVEALRALNPGKLLRICTGELADSLALESVATAAAFLVERFARMDGVLLELKTKSTNIGHLLDLDHRDRPVISRSLNPESMAAREERGAPDPIARLRAAADAVKAGYTVAFHFDPIIRIERWQEAYQGLVEDLFEAVPARAVRWISLGGFRFTPKMKERILARFPETRLFFDEFFPCFDGKYRYFSKHRIAIYREMLRNLRARGPKVPVYLCMEPAFVWRRVFGCLPEELPLLKEIYGVRHCN